MAMAYTQAITYGPGGQMYTDGSRQTPYNPPQNMNTQERNTDFGPVTISSPGFSGSQRMQPFQDMRARPPQEIQLKRQAGGFDGNPSFGNFGPQRGIGSFPNPFGNRGGFNNPYGGSRGGFGMQQPGFGRGFRQPPQFGGGMYGNPYGGGGFGMQRPPQFGGGYGMQQPGFGGGIGGMFPGMGGGYGQRPPMYGGGGFGGGFRQPPSFGGIGGGFRQPMPQPMPIQIGRPQPMPIQVGGPVRPPFLDKIRPVRPKPMPIAGAIRGEPVRIGNYGLDRRIENDVARQMPEMQTKGPENLNRYNRYKGMPFENFESVAF